LGCGFLQAVCQEALALELSVQKVPYQREVKLPLFYEGYQLKSGSRAYFVCFSAVAVELTP
jgi:GxxExxY protein